MTRYKIAPAYNEKYLEVDRPQPLSDAKIDSLINEVMSAKMDIDLTNQLYDDFKFWASKYILTGNNSLNGLENFPRVDIINGCTQFIDNLYMKNKIQVLQGDYKYHQRLNPNIEFSQVKRLKEKVPLIIALPFPSLGSIHPSMNEILDECISKEIDVHIDGAWITAGNNLSFDFNHSVIKSVGISLSKGCGLGWNRIGLRWSKEYDCSDSISIMNDFHMNNRALVLIGKYFVCNLPKDHLWSTHSKRYYKICNDFNLTPTHTIHLALRNNEPVGISPLIRYLEQNGF